MRRLAFNHCKLFEPAEAQICDPTFVSASADEFLISIHDPSFILIPQVVNEITSEIPKPT